MQLCQIVLISFQEKKNLILLFVPLFYQNHENSHLFFKIEHFDPSTFTLVSILVSTLIFFCEGMMIFSNKKGKLWSQKLYVLLSKKSSFLEKKIGFWTKIAINMKIEGRKCLILKRKDYVVCDSKSCWDFIPGSQESWRRYLFFKKA